MISRPDAQRKPCALEGSDRGGWRICESTMRRAESAGTAGRKSSENCRKSSENCRLHRKAGCAQWIERNCRSLSRLTAPGAAVSLHPARRVRVVLISCGLIAELAWEKEKGRPNRHRKEKRSKTRPKTSAKNASRTGANQARTRSRRAAAPNRASLKEIET